jgi:DNA-binding FadR family transcriptional regulator
VVASWRESAGLDTLATLVGSLSPEDPTWFEIVTSALEVRRILASEAVALAVTRHTPADLETIAACARAVQDHTADPIAYARADLAFMRAVVRAARNVGLELLLNTFARWPDQSPRLVESLYDHGSTYVGLYEVLVQIIRAGNAEQARALIRRGLEEMDDAWARRHAPQSTSRHEKKNSKKRNSKKESGK